MKLKGLLIFSFVFSMGWAKADMISDMDKDMETLEKLTSASEEFFNAFDGAKIFQDDNGQATVTLSRAELRKIIADFRGTNKVWDPMKDEQCRSLVLPTAAIGSCVVRSLALALAGYYEDFQATKRLLRSQGDFGIEATKKLSAAVKSETAHLAAQCDLSTAVGWGGSGQGLGVYNCWIDGIQKGLKKLAVLRNIVAEPNSALARTARLKARGLTDAKWSSRVTESDEILGYGLKHLQENIDQFFKESLESEEGHKFAREAMERSQSTWREVRTNYCKAYAAVLLGTFKDDSRFGSQTAKACEVELSYERSNTLQSSAREFSM